MSDVVANVLIGVVSASVGLFGAYLLYLVTRRNKDPSWAIRSNNLFRDHISRLEGLQILYAESQVESLTISRILFWNRGKDPIRKNDIAEDIEIVASGDADILDARLLQSSNPSNQVTISPPTNGKSAKVNFNYLDHGNGGVFQIVHTGISSSSITIQGNIIGSKQIRKRTIIIIDIPNAPLWRWIRNIAGQKGVMRAYNIIVWLPFVLWLALGVSALITSLPIGSNDSVDVTGIVVGIVLLTFGIIGVFFMIGRTWRMKVPRGLEIYRKDMLEQMVEE